MRNKVEAANELMGLISKRLSEVLEEMKSVHDQLVDLDNNGVQVESEYHHLFERADQLKEINDFYGDVAKAINDNVMKGVDMSKMVELLMKMI